MRGLNSFSKLKLINHESLLNFVNSLKDKSYSPDGIPTRAIKTLASVSPKAITDFVNASLEFAIVTEILKDGVPRPILKKGNRDEMADFRRLTMTSPASVNFWKNQFSLRQPNVINKLFV